ncbi:hypothetical protein HQQ80_01995 [Microbacteriaceae bacterium VKM Ac-2855]|nr:hypothetical protein [Microbacteriaceae bacterium VKM Ac-2855]
MKDISGIAKAPDELLVEPGPGSVRAIFIAPPRHSSDVMQVPESLDETIPEDDSYSESLWRLATVLANAGPTEDGSAVADGALAALPGQARFELRKAMDEVVSEGWDLWGDFTQRGRQPTELHLSNESARFLRDVLVDRSVSRSPWETTGFLDGHTWSTNTMRFIAANQASSITATFENPKVQLEVARLDVQPDQYVRAQFMVTTTTSPARPHGVRSYSIVSVAIVPRESEPVTLDL